MSAQEAHYKKLERMYLHSNINTQVYPSTTATISHERAEIRMTLHPRYFHALGAAHGAVYFKLLDDAAFFSVLSVITDFFVLTASFNIQLIRPVSTGSIKAIGTLLFQSKTLFVADATLYNERGKEIAFGTGNFIKTKIALTPEIGYE